MGVDVDEARADDTVGAVMNPGGLGVGEAPDARDPSVGDRDVSGKARRLQPVNDGAVLCDCNSTIFTIFLPPG